METGLPWNAPADTSPDLEAHPTQQIEGLWERGRSRVRHASGDPFSAALDRGESHCQGPDREADGYPGCGSDSSYEVVAFADGCDVLTLLRSGVGYLLSGGEDRAESGTLFRLILRPRSEIGGRPN